jgi:diguanylate cyclase (GGDEF)-like protein
MVVFVFSFRGIATLLQASEMPEQPETRVSRTRSALQGARTVDALAARMLSETRTLLRFDEFLLVLSDLTGGRRQTRLHEGGSAPPAAARMRAAIDAVIAEGHPRLALSADPEGSLLAIPLNHDDARIGGLCIRRTGAQRYSRADVNLMQHLADQIAPALSDALALEDLERESLEDALTGIANHRCFDLRLAAELERARTSGAPLCLAVADLDRFKAVNDELGHLVGDEVLRISARLLEQHVGPTDLVARIGGEEFALLLPGMSRESALRLCEAVRVAFAAKAWTDVHLQLRVTMSIGLAQWDGGSLPSALLARADECLYAAKRGGRNRVDAGPSLPPSS